MIRVERTPDAARASLRNVSLRNLPVSGMICMMPRAPTGETMSVLKSAFDLITANTIIGSR